MRRLSPRQRIMRLEAAARQLEVDAQDAGRELLSGIELAEMVVVASCAAVALARAIDSSTAEAEIAQARGHLAHLQSLTRESSAAWQRRLAKLRTDLVSTTVTPVSPALLARVRDEVLR